MARPNPLEPVIVNVTSMSVSIPDNYTRNFMVASFGDTTMPQGESKVISKSSRADAGVKENSHLSSFLSSYFANNSNGSIRVLELKEDKTIPHKHIYVVGDYYLKDAKMYECIQNDEATSDTSYEPVKITDTQFWKETTEIKKYKAGDYYIDSTNNKEYICLKEDTATSEKQLQPKNITNEKYWKEAVDEASIKRAVTLLRDFITAGKIRVYEIAMPNIFYSSEDFIALVKEYGNITDALYFSIEIPEGSNPELDETFKKYAKSKAFTPIVPSGNSGESVHGAITGIKASSLYDLGSENPLSLLQWKKVSGIQAQDSYGTTLETAYNQNGCSWVGIFNKQAVVLGGMVGDGKNWEFYFALDTFIYYLTTEISTMMIQASNNPLRALHFNREGVATVGKKLVSIATAMLKYGVLEDFGQSYDEATYSITNSGEWNIIDYATFKANNYTKWTEGIYDGASVFATIGNFLLQIKPNITIE